MPTRLLPSFSVLIAVAACSDESATSDKTPLDAGGQMTMARDAAMPEASAAGDLGGPLMYTGELTMEDVVPPRYMCESPFGGGTGDNISPPLEWTGGPAETKSFGLVLYDASFGSLHWVVWDIPATATSLPEGIPPGYNIADPPGAHQAPGNSGYFGPCSSGAIAQTYEYRLSALDVETLPLTESSTPEEAQAAVEDAAIETTVWAGTPE